VLQVYQWSIAAWVPKRYISYMSIISTSITAERDRALSYQWSVSNWPPEKIDFYIGKWSKAVWVQKSIDGVGEGGGGICYPSAFSELPGNSQLTHAI
jgi:hypothetical protein